MTRLSILIISIVFFFIIMPIALLAGGIDHVLHWMNHD